MSDIPLDCLHSFFRLQTWAGGQIPYYKGRLPPSDFHRGSGLGSILAKGARMLLPVAKTGLRELGHSGLKVMSDVLQGDRTIKQALSYRGKELANKGLKRGLQE